MVADLVEPYVRRLMRWRAAVIERACEGAVIAGCGVTVNDDEGWAMPDPDVPAERMVIHGYPRAGAWDPPYRFER